MNLKRLLLTGILGGGGLPAISVSPSSWNAGSTPVGTPVSQEFEILNPGTAALEITLPITIVGAEASAFTVTVQPASSSLAPGASTTFTVQADADSVDTFNADISIVSNAAGSPTLVAIEVVVSELAAPTLSSPADAAVQSSLTPTFSWNAVVGASTYTLQIDNTSDFASPLVDASGIAGTSYNAYTFVGGGTFYWRVRAVNGVHVSAWATYRSVLIPVVYDTFTDTNGTLLGAHTISGINLPATAWTVHNGNLRITSNRVLGNAVDPGNPGHNATLDAGVADYVITLTVRITSSGGAKRGGVIVRRGAGGEYYAVHLGLYAEPATFAIVEWNGATFTTRASAAPVLAVNTDYTLRVVVSGNSITATIGGANSINYGSASVNNSSTLAGLFNRSASGENQFDDFILIP